MNELCVDRESVKSFAQRLSVRYAAGLVAGAIMGLSPAAHAQSSPDLSQTTAMLKKLEARVSALEAENRQSRKEADAARAEAHALRQRIGERKPAATTVAAAPANVVMAAPIATRPYEVKSPTLPITAGWAGLYAGAAGGVGWLHGNEALTDISNSFSTSTFVATTSAVTSTTSEAVNLTGRDPGVMSSLFLGYNHLIDNDWLIGGQLEGTLANTRASLRGDGSIISASTTVATPPGGAAGTSTSTSLQTISGATDTLDNRWMISVLARAGYLVDARDLIYLVGGYTYGRFEADQTGFGMNGGTIGVGWEKQIIGGWNLRAEYRYTRFASTTVNLTESSESSLSTTGAFTQTGSGPSNATIASRFSDVDLHAIWLGVSHSFGP